MNPTFRTLAVGATAGAALLVAVSAFAGQEPVVAVVLDDKALSTFYVSEKLYQFTHPNTDSAYTNSAFNPEAFRSSAPINKAEVCLSPAADPPPTGSVNTNALIPHGNAGWYEWDIVLPKKPQGMINIVIQCGVLKDEAYAFFGQRAIDLCAGETGERIGQGFCTRQNVPASVNPVVPAWLPLLTVNAAPGPYATPGFDINQIGPRSGGGRLAVGPQGLLFGPGDDWFPLIAYRTPGPYEGAGGVASVLTGTATSRVLLKACQSEAVIAKFPVTGFQAPIVGRPEWDLEAGDRIHVRLFIPNGHSMDIYCHRHSVRVQYNGDPQTLLP
jgi:hypothetical protein